MIQEAKITDFENGHIEYVKDGVTFEALDCFRYIPTTPETGWLKIRFHPGVNRWLYKDQRHDIEEFEDCIALIVAEKIDEFWQ